VVEDILDTGRTFSYLQEVLGAHDPASLKLAALLDKHSRRIIPVEADYVVLKSRCVRGWLRIGLRSEISQPRGNPPHPFTPDVVSFDKPE